MAILSAGEHIQQQELTRTAGADINGHHHFGKCFDTIYYSWTNTYAVTNMAALLLNICVTKLHKAGTQGFWRHYLKQVKTANDPDVYQ